MIEGGTAMDNTRLIEEMLQLFMQSFFVKYQYEYRGVLKKMRIDNRLNMEIDEEKWCESFLYKACLNRCAQILLMRILEDQGLIYSKMNKEGLEKWRKLAKNIATKFDILYHIGLQDLQADENKKIRSIFGKSDYDLLEIDDELAEIVVQYASVIDFSNIQREEIIKFFRKLYSLEGREEWHLENFYKEAPALRYILKLEKEEFLFEKRIK